MDFLQSFAEQIPMLAIGILFFLRKQIKHRRKDEVKKHAVVGESFGEMEILIEKRCGEDCEVKQKSGVKNPAAPKRRGNQKRQKSKSNPSRMDDAIPIYNIRPSDINKLQPIKKHNQRKNRKVNEKFSPHGLILAWSCCY